MVPLAPSHVARHTRRMKRSNSIIAGLIATLALGGGCVSAKKYEALEADLAKTRGELTKAQGEVKDLSAALTETEAEVETLRGQVADLEEKLAVAEGRAVDAENQLAEVLKDKSKLTASI